MFNNDNVLKTYWNCLKDLANPSSRVARKVLMLSALLAIWLAWHRHAELELESIEAIGGTALLVLGLLSVFGFFGGVLAAALYGWFLEDVNAQNCKLTINVFIVEWIIAAASPAIVFLVAYVVMGNAR